MPYDGASQRGRFTVSDQYDEYLEQSSGSNRRVAVLILTIAIVGVAAIFMVQNTAQTSVEFLFLTGQAPLYVVILVSMVSGALLAIILGGARRRRRRRATE